MNFSIKLNNCQTPDLDQDFILGVDFVLPLKQQQQQEQEQQQEQRGSIINVGERKVHYSRREESVSLEGKGGDE